MKCNLNYGFWVNMMHQRRFINCNKYAPPVQDTHKGGFASEGSRNEGNFHVSLSQFCCKPKTALKVTVLRNNNNLKKNPQMGQHQRMLL